MLLKKSQIAGSGLKLFRGFCQPLTEGDLTTLNNLSEMGEGRRQGQPCRTRAARGAKQTRRSSDEPRPRATQPLQEIDKQAERVSDPHTLVLVFTGLL